MDTASPAARRLELPRWLNARLLAGLVLVLLATLLGARVVAAADTSELVWAAHRDLPAGYRLQASDLRPVRVRLGAAAGRYLAAGGGPPIGYALRQPVAAGELLPGTALVTSGGEAADRRVVALPVRQGHWPQDLAAGDVVDVYATPRHDGAAVASGSAAGAQATLVLSAVPVQRVPGGDRGVFSGGDSGPAVDVSVPAADVARVVAAVESGDLDLVRAPSPATAGSGS